MAGGGRHGATMIGALDVGSNSVLMLVAEISGGAARPLGDFLRITRLGRGVDRSGLLDPASAALTLDAIAELAGKARDLGAQRFVTAATAALRDARNGARFIEQVRQ